MCHNFSLVKNIERRCPAPLTAFIASSIFLGIPVKVFVTVAGAKWLKAYSLRIKVVEKTGATHADQLLIPVGTSGARYFVKFSPPTVPFKLVLYGLTPKGNSFKRESPKLDQTVPVLLKYSYKEASNILHRGQRTKLIVQILRGNTGERAQKYTLKLKDDRGYGTVTRGPRTVYRGRKGFARITFVVPTDAPSGKIVNAELSLIRHGETIPVATLLSSFLLV